ncbi:hypothetical protein N7510_001332 [Penicillium lagena]|uniref:uncharacterized protein n=1 Tax=Penicillium lagena TaxID=94218 RepID=UPI00253F9882|nr:uncharacterized protein N7510_001332 [Penicillium lagena]KAJ5625023.1 hypothetical protein N7510_001332 [Penicillium lagena]
MLDTGAHRPPSSGDLLQALDPNLGDYSLAPGPCRTVGRSAWTVCIPLSTRSPFQPNGLTSFSGRENDFRRSGRLTLVSVVFTEFPRVATVTPFSAAGSRDRWLMDPPCRFNHHRQGYAFFFRDSAPLPFADIPVSPTPHPGASGEWGPGFCRKKQSVMSPVPSGQTRVWATIPKTAAPGVHSDPRQTRFSPQRGKALSPSLRDPAWSFPNNIALSARPTNSKQP